MSLTKEQVFSVLRTCSDPEMPVNIVDLGLVYGVEIKEDAATPSTFDVVVKMTLTSPSCPMSHMITADVQRKLSGMEHVKHAKVELVWEPAWHSSMITTEGRQHLNLA